jgi:hypothetical protein
MVYEPQFMEDEIAIVQQALMYYWDNNIHLTQEQFEAVQGALAAIEAAL